MNDGAMDSSKCLKGARIRCSLACTRPVQSRLQDQLFSISDGKNQVDLRTRGNPISISFEPMETRRSNMAFLLRILHGLNEGLIAIT